MDNKQLLDTALLAGAIILQSGAEIWRAEDTMQRLLGLSPDAKAIEVYATTTGIVLMLEPEGAPPITALKRIDNRTNNLGRIAGVNEVSRELTAGAIDLTEAGKRLRAIEQRLDYPRWLRLVCTTLVPTGFAVFLGGNGQDLLAATLTGICLSLGGLLLERGRFGGFVADMIRSFVVAMAAIGCAMLLPGIRTEIVITAGIMPMVPGVAFTNAIRDTLHGDYMAGGARMTESFVAGLAIAVGVGAGLGFVNLLWGVLA